MSSPVKKRKERKAAKREKRNGTKFWMTDVDKIEEDHEHELNTGRAARCGHGRFKRWLEDVNFRK